MSLEDMQRSDVPRDQRGESPLKYWPRQKGFSLMPLSENYRISHNGDSNKGIIISLPVSITPQFSPSLTV